MHGQPYPEDWFHAIALEDEHGAYLAQRHQTRMTAAAAEPVEA